jgi:arsenate reductase-like glutaredoxin family protein
VLSKRSTAYRARPDEIEALDDAALVEAMVAEPTLLRRPLMITENEAIVGFDRKKLDRITGS